MSETMSYDVFTYHDLSSPTLLGVGDRLPLDGETWEVRRWLPRFTQESERRSTARSRRRGRLSGRTGIPSADPDWAEASSVAPGLPLPPPNGVHGAFSVGRGK